MSDTPPAPALSPSSARAEAAPARKKNDGLFAYILKLALFVFVLRSFIVTPFSIPSESMLPRLLVGDFLVVSKWSYGYSRHSLPFSIPLLPGDRRIFGSLPERGDVAVFKAPPGHREDYIKRVIGLPGDTVEMRGGTLFLNGQEVAKERRPDFVLPTTPNSPCLAPEFIDGANCRYPRFVERLPGGKSYEVLDLGQTQADDTPVFTVPAGHVFMLGDDRDRSADSRFPAVVGGGIGFVPVANLVGKAQVTAFSTDGSASLLPWTWISAGRWSRIGEGF